MIRIAKWAACFAAICTAQTPQDTQFETKVTNIHLDVRATYQGKGLPNLIKDDFAIRDEGQIRPILSFEEVPLDLVLVVDTGWWGLYPEDFGKQTRKTAAVLASAMKRMRSFDRTAVVSFAVDPRVDQELTSDPAQVAAALARIPGNSHLSRSFIALRWAAWLLEADAKKTRFGPGGTPETRKRAVLIVTGDHLDFNPSTEWDDPLIDLYWESDVALNAIVFLGPPTPKNVLIPDAYHDLSEVARATGGEAVTGIVMDSLEKHVSDLFDGVQSSYTLFCAPPSAKPGEVRHITVELSDEAKMKYPGAVIHAREGYIAR